MTNHSIVPNRKPRSKAVVNQRDCVGCGKCVRECPASVIALKEVSP